MKSTKRRKVKPNLKMIVGMLSTCVLMSFTMTIQAQSDRRDNDRYESDRYEDGRDSDRYDDRRGSDRRDERRRPSYSYCKDRAYDITGYRGSSPKRYRERGALGSAIKGGIDAGAASWVTGGDKKQIRKARERGAKLGFLIGAIKSGAERERRRRDDDLRRDFEYELRDCMRG